MPQIDAVECEGGRSEPAFDRRIECRLHISMIGDAAVAGASGRGISFGRSRLSGAVDARGMSIASDSLLDSLGAFLGRLDRRFPGVLGSLTGILASFLRGLTRLLGLVLGARLRPDSSC
jgi:hypothetical protein